ncbi:hypothetical protein FRB95_012071 [Tulasnella sp. JGI-2019a]|nr:hypothetical protein FRB95_012071 [Tulasnella sp. JGI-2019a]
MYNDPIPTQVPVIVLIRHVKTKSELADTGMKWVFCLSTSEYVHDTQQAFEVQVVFNLTKARRANTPSPFVNTCIKVVGSLSGYNLADGVIHIKPEHLCLNLSSLLVASTAATLSDPSTVVNPSALTGKPAMKKKFSGNASITLTKKSCTTSAVMTPSTPSTPALAWNMSSIQSSPINNPSMAFPTNLPNSSQSSMRL